MCCASGARAARKNPRNPARLPACLSAAHNGGSRLDNPKDYEEHDPQRESEREGGEEGGGGASTQAQFTSFMLKKTGGYALLDAGVSLPPPLLLESCRCPPPTYPPPHTSPLSSPVRPSSSHPLIYQLPPKRWRTGPRGELSSSR